jgi:hypothetical protein
MAACRSQKAAALCGSLVRSYDAEQCRQRKVQRMASVEAVCRVVCYIRGRPVQRRDGRRCRHAGTAAGQGRPGRVIAMAAVGPALDGMPCGQSENRDAEVFDVLGALSYCCNLTGPDASTA